DGDRRGFHLGVDTSPSLLHRVASNDIFLDTSQPIVEQGVMPWRPKLFDYYRKASAPYRHQRVPRWHTDRSIRPDVTPFSVSTAPRSSDPRFRPGRLLLRGLSRVRFIRISQTLGEITCVWERTKEGICNLSSLR